MIAKAIGLSGDFSSTLIHCVACDERLEWSTQVKRSETAAAEECIALGAAGRQLDAYPNRDVNLGALAVAHTLMRFELLAWSRPEPASDINLPILYKS